MFVTYTDASQFTAKDKRRQISQYAAYTRHHRASLKWVDPPQNGLPPAKRASRAPMRSRKRQKTLPVESASETSDLTDRDAESSIDAATPSSDDTELTEEGPQLPSHHPAELTFSGHRSDPFSSFSLEDKSVLKVLDVFSHILVPKRCRLYGITNPAVIDRVGYVWRCLIASDSLVHDALVFNALAFMHAGQASLATVPGEKSNSAKLAITLHRSRAIEQIHRRIDNGEFNDVLLQCVMSMLLADSSLRDYRSIEVHARGIESLIRLQGGFKQVGSSNQVFSVAHKLQIMMIRNSSRLSLRHPNFLQDRDKSDYPSHPFAPELCAQLSSLPEGFSNLVLDGKLSTDLIRIMSDFGKWFQSVVPNPDHPKTLQKPHLSGRGWHTIIPDRLSIFERILAIALLSLGDDLVDVAVHNLWRGVSALNLHTALIELLSSAAVFSFDGTSGSSTTGGLVSDNEVQAIVWATTVIACPADPHFNPSKKGQYLLADLIACVPRVKNRSALEGTLRLFYCEAGCLNRWRAGWDNAMKLADANDEVARQWTGKSLQPLKG